MIANSKKSYIYSGNYIPILETIF